MCQLSTTSVPVCGRGGRDGPKKMARYIDHVLTLLPFEPDALARLGGPAASYVGHPLNERLEWIANRDVQALAARLNLEPTRTPVVVLPGSRSTEVERLVPVFGDTIREVQQMGPRCEVLIPCVPHLRSRIMELTADWPCPVHYLDGDDDKFSAFRLARAALAASGTVTLELGVSGTPMVVAYRVDGVAARLRFLVKVPSIVLANLVIDENAFPEFIQEDCTAEKLGPALTAIISEGAAREAQLAALDRVVAKISEGQGLASERAADVVEAMLAGAGQS